jgi:hypothetical protein
VRNGHLICRDLIPIALEDLDLPVTGTNELPERRLPRAILLLKRGNSIEQITLFEDV